MRNNAVRGCSAGLHPTGVHNTKHLPSAPGQGFLAQFEALAVCPKGVYFSQELSHDRGLPAIMA